MTITTKQQRQPLGRRVPRAWSALTMLAKLSPATLMLMKGHLSLKSLAAATVFTVCLPAPSLAATKWARCTPYPKDRAITVVYDVELKTDSAKISLIRDVRVDQNKLAEMSPNAYAESSRSQIIAPAQWFPTEVVLGPFEGNPFTYTGSSGKTITSKTTRYLSISRQDLSYDFGSEVLNVKSWSRNFGSCKIIPNPVKTLF